jgi:hypothetical protein
MSHRLAYTVALPLFTGLVGGLTHYLMTGKHPEELKDLVFPATGQTDKEGHAVRLQMPGYMADVVKYGKDIKRGVTGDHPLDALTSVSHKTHPLLNTTLEMLRNQDYFGTKIANEDDPLMQRIIDRAKHVGKAFVPFGVRDVVKLAGEGQGAKSALPLAGIVRARSDVTHTDAENLASEMLRDSHPQGTRTQADADRSKTVREFADSLYRKEPKAKERIQQAYKSGALREADVERIEQDQKYPGSLERMVRHLDPEQAFKVWEAATDAEKKRLGLSSRPRSGRPRHSTGHGGWNWSSVLRRTGRG